MKVSELKALVTRLVAEEVARQVPQVLTEMFVKELVRECVTASRPVVEAAQRSIRVPQPAPRREPARARPSSLEEALDFDPGAGAEFYQGMEYEDSPEPAFVPSRIPPQARSVIPEGLDPMLAGMVDEETLRGLETHNAGPTKSIPLEKAESVMPGLDFSKQRAMVEAMERLDRRKRA